jgi:hypothetical protein
MSALFSRIEVKEYARKIGKSERTLWRWIKAGCDPRDKKSLREWQVRNEIRQTPMERARRRKRDNEQKAQNDVGESIPPHSPPTNGDLPQAGKRGAAAALERLEHQEEESHRRLQAALGRGDPMAIQAAQEFWLKCSETLRRLDLAVEVARRNEETQVPLKVAEDTITAASEWMRVSVMQFLSSESVPLMGLKDIGEFKAYFVDRFKGILDLTVKNSLKTQSPVPEWASRRIKTAWNIN